MSMIWLNFMRWFLIGFDFRGIVVKMSCVCLFLVWRCWCLLLLVSVLCKFVRSSHIPCIDLARCVWVSKVFSDRFCTIIHCVSIDTIVKIRGMMRNELPTGTSPVVYFVVDHYLCCVLSNHSKHMF